MSDDYMPENNLDGPPSKARKLSQGKCQWFAARRPWHHQAVDAQTAKQTWTLHLNWSMFRKFQAQTSNLATVGRQITVHFMAAIFFFYLLLLLSSIQSAESNVLGVYQHCYLGFIETNGNVYKHVLHCTEVAVRIRMQSARSAAKRCCPMYTFIWIDWWIFSKYLCFS